MDTSKSALEQVQRDALLVVLRNLPPRAWFNLKQVSRHFRSFRFDWTLFGAHSEQEFMERVMYLPPDLRQAFLGGTITLAEAVPLSYLTIRLRQQVVNKTLTFQDAARMHVIPPMLQQLMLEPLNLKLDEIWRLLNTENIPEHIQRWRHQIREDGVLAQRQYREFLQDAMRTGLLPEEENITNTCRWIGQMDSSMIPLLLKRYIPLPHQAEQSLLWEKKFLTLVRGGTPEKSRCFEMLQNRPSQALCALFDEGYFNRGWVDLSKSGEYLNLIRLPDSQESLDAMIAAIREGVITQECLASCKSSVIRFLLSPYGIEARRKNWLQPIDFVRAETAATLIERYRKTKSDILNCSIAEVVVGDFPEDPPEVAVEAAAPARAAASTEPVDAPVLDHDGNGNVLPERDPPRVPGPLPSNQEQGAILEQAAADITELKKALTTTIQSYLNVPIIFHKKRAVSVKSRLSHANNVADLEQLLQGQLNLFKPEVKRRPLFQFFDRNGPATQRLRHKVTGPEWGYFKTLEKCRKSLIDYKKSHAQSEVAYTI